MASNPVQNGPEAPGKDLCGFVPAGHPRDWVLAGKDEVVYWAFLDEISDKPVRPWLVVREEGSAIGTIRIVVPRLVPQAGWVDARDYSSWEEAVWHGETAPSIPSVVTIADLAAELPRSPTRPRWSNPERLVSVALRADVLGMSSSEIVEEDEEDALAGERVRGVRKEIERGRRLLAAVGALPWVGMDGPTKVLSRSWWTTAGFRRSLGCWRHDATNLSWRRGRESGPPDDPAREAAGLVGMAPWRTPSDAAMALARGRLTESASTFDGSLQEWLEQLIAYPHQSKECRQDLVQRAEMDGSASELHAIWTACRHQP